MMYYIKPHNEYICSISDSDFDFGNGWSLMGETATHFYMSTDNIDKAYTVAKALGVSITTVNTAWEIDPCLLEYDIMYLDTLSWTVEYWDSLPVEMINAIVATGDTYSFDLYTKAYAYMRNGFDVANNQCDIDWDAPELPDDECTAIVYFPVQPASIVLIHDAKLDDVKLPVIEPVEVIVPQEILLQPLEDLSTTTEDNVMNTSTLIPSWEVSGYVSLLDLDFGTYVPVVEVEPIVELTGQASDFACHISDGWYGQCCDLAERPLSTEEREAVEHKVEQFANGVKAHVKQYKRELRPTQEIETLARIKELVEQSQVPTTTTKSGKVVQVSPHCITPHGNAPATNCITNPKVTSAIGEAEAVVTEFKSTLINLDEYDITRNVVVDVATTTPKATPATPKAPATPKPSTAKFANNFNSLVMAKYRELNGGIIKDSLVLNKLTSALRANNSEAYTNLVTTFNNATAVALHRKAYDAVVSAS